MDESIADAKKSIEKFSGLLRYQLYDQQQMVPIKQEIDYLRNFIELQQARSSERLRLQVDFDEHLNGEQGLIALRLLQALGGCVGMVAARAMVRDLFEVKENAKIFSTLMLVVAVSPIVAPTLGGYVTAVLGWRYVFIILIYIALFILAGIYYLLPESKQPDPNFSLKPEPIIKNFYGIIRHPQFATYAFTGAVSNAGLYAYISGSPYVFMEIFKVSEKQYGWIFALIAMGLIGASQINNRFGFVGRYSNEYWCGRLGPGITTYSPLNHWKVGPGKKVGVIGVGGLGHVGIKIAKAMGAEVVVFTTSAGKAADAKRLGADEVVLSNDKAQMNKHVKTFHFILDAVSAVHDINAYLPLLKLDGTMVLVGLPEHPLPILPFNVVLHRRSLAGSLIGGIKETQEMLDFCSKHNITADIELINIQQINEAYERLLKGDVRYRFVIDMASIKK
eukprot:jgi/Mesen1/291/ME1156283C09493